MNNIFVFGSLNMDVIIKVNDFPKHGETIQGVEYFTAPGGKGANQALAAARLGASVSIVGTVGNDDYGNTLVSSLSGAHTNVSHIARGKEPTGIAFVTVNKKGSNFIVIVSGANAETKETTVKQALETIKPGDIVVCQLEIPLETVEYVFVEAKKRGATIVFNPSPIRDYNEKILKYADILVLNEVEARVITEDKYSDENRLMKKLLRKNIPCVVLTLGEKGAILGEKNHTEAIRWFPTFDIANVVDTTGAGDAFIGGLVKCLSEGKALKESISYANAVGSIATTRFGAQTSLPTKEEVDSFLKTTKQKE